jgi:hypothetical protein
VRGGGIDRCSGRRRRHLAEGHYLTPYCLKIWISPCLRHGGRPKVIDDDMLTFALALRAKGVPVLKIATKLTIKTGVKAGKNPSAAPVYLTLADAAEAETSQPVAS